LRGGEFGSAQISRGSGSVAGQQHRVPDLSQSFPVDALREKRQTPGEQQVVGYGLHNMRERAKLVGGELAIWSEMDSGTEVELTIPASRAYTKPVRRFWFFEKLSKRNPDAKEKIES
jgi:hypothetical protein